MVELNTDNLLLLHGKMIDYDFTKGYYQVTGTNKTACEIPISVYNPKKKNSKYKNDLFYVTFYGFQISKEHPNGGLLEAFLSTIKTKCYVQIYAHLEIYNFLYQDGRKGSRIKIIADTFKIDNLSLDLQKSVEETFKGVSPKKGRERNYEEILDEDDDKKSEELS